MFIITELFSNFSTITIAIPIGQYDLYSSVGFNVIAKTTLRTFWETHADSKGPLEDLYRRLRESEATNFAQLRADFATADFVQPDIIIFNVKGNHYRLVTAVSFSSKKVFIKGVYTHAEYGKLKIGG